MSDNTSSNEFEPQQISERAATIDYLAEQILIQSLLGFPDSLDIYNVTAEFFQEPTFKALFGMVKALREKGEPTTLDHILIRFKEHFSKEFEAFFRDIYWQRDTFKLHPQLAFYVDFLTKRQLKKSFEELKWRNDPSKENPQEGIQEFIDKAKDLLDKHQPPIINMFEQDWAKVLEIADDAANGIKPHALRTYFDILDKLLGECVLDDYLIILGAESGAGKTSFALNWIKNIAVVDKYQTLYLSFEMGRLRLMRWFMAAVCEIPMNNFTAGTLTDKNWSDIGAVMTQFLPTNALTIVETFPDIVNVVKVIRAYCKANPDCKFIVIDHLHLMTWSKVINPTEVVSYITRSLKHLAMELQVPILLLSQLKKPEITTNAIQAPPSPSLLKGSGSIITDADLIMILQIDKKFTNHFGDRRLQNYILKNRGGVADGQCVNFRHYPYKCLIEQEK